MAFPATRWTLVQAAASPAARAAALEALLRLYWGPVYAYARRRGLGPEDAEELVQELFAELVEKAALAGVDRGRGRFRSWLLACTEHRLAHRAERARARKRAVLTVPLQTEGLEAWLASSEPSPEEAWRRSWAEGVLARAMSALKAEYDQGRREGDFALLARFFGGGPAPGYREAAAEAGMSLPQLKSFVHRARGRLRELVLAELADTVAPGEAEAELAELLG